MGSLTTRGTDTFTYDDRQRLSAFGATASYTYNARGERASKTVAGVTTQYVYDEAGHLIAELDPSTTPPTALRSYVWLDDRPVAVYAHTGAYANQWLHIHTDHLGTPRAITRPAASNTTVWRWDFNGSAFGDHAPLTDPDSDATHFTFNLRFPGQYFDAESGLHYNYFRDYEQGVGRYAKSDPIGLKGGINTYGYVRANPLKFVDPEGLKVQLCCRKAELLWGLISHCWIKTDTISAGMASSPRCRANVGDDYEFPWVTPTCISDHSCEVGNCKDVPTHWNIDEDCVNRNLNIGDALGGFDPFVNNCQQFTQRVFRKCSKPSWPTPPPPPSSPAPSGGGCCNQ